MILKGSKRGGAVDLGKHLLKPENEHVEVHEIRGFIADTVIDAFREAYAISRGTKCQKFLFSLSLSPPEQEIVPVATFEKAIDEIEAKLGLEGQPRVVIFHEKEARRHAHCVWSRIDAATMTAIDQPHFKLKLCDVSRDLYLEYGWRMPDGLIDPLFRNPLNFDQKEWFQAKRTGQDPRMIKAIFQRCWETSDSGKAFQHALEERGYWLARGDRRGVVAVDIHGEVYAVARWANVKSKDVVQRIGDLQSLPSVDEAKRQIETLVRAKLEGFVASLTEEFSTAARTLEARRIDIVERHRAARSELQAKQQARWEEECRRRSARFRKGLLGLWDRVTGKHDKFRRQNEQDVIEAEGRDAAEAQALIEEQLQERSTLQSEIKRARKSHLRDVTRSHRELFARHREQNADRANIDPIDAMRFEQRRRRRRNIEP